MAANKNSHLGFSLISLIFLFSIPKSLSALDPEPAVWDMLPKYGLPSGLLPSTVTDYVLHEDGRFIVTLDSPCYVQFEYLVYYDKTITGKLGYGSITDLKGIQVKRFLFWLDVDEITVDLPPSGSIYFQVGFINKKLDVDQFQTVHSCRDGVTGSCKYSWKSVLQLVERAAEISCGGDSMLLDLDCSCLIWARKREGGGDVRFTLFGANQHHMLSYWWWVRVKWFDCLGLGRVTPCCALCNFGWDIAIGVWCYG
ncbi:hypothetical protein GOBAR_AA05603 [Gossypium barbadense]|uniref:DUF538 domain-containing protein n=1 Tax=Gossypium barbadense TaxID=3634 RepID=A0A2P5YHC2_GOSBA|nr:hypothetical protein GOBAR_AA05603 [Gossypium barbadense]